MFRFTIRDVLWLTVVAVLCGWMLNYRASTIRKLEAVQSAATTLHAEMKKGAAAQEELLKATKERGDLLQQQNDLLRERIEIQKKGD